jgi:oxalate decarboxylase/phosphoglucose isomerase-like protein (cupin superfamily)
VAGAAEELIDRHEAGDNAIVVRGAGAGAVVFVPRGVLHGVANLGTIPAWLLAVYAPAGIDRYFEELVATQAARGPLDAAAIRAIAAKHGTLQIPSPTGP